MLQTGDICTNTGDNIIKVLCSKHFEARPATDISLDSYVDAPLSLVPVVVTPETFA